MGVRTVHRKVLLEALAEELSPGTIRFSTKLASIETEVLEDSSTTTLLKLEDGAVIRAKVHNHQNVLEFHPLICEI